MDSLDLEADSAAKAQWLLKQVVARMDAELALIEDAQRIRKIVCEGVGDQEDHLLLDLSRIQSEYAKSRSEVQDALDALEPGDRDPSKALGLADSLVGRIDFLIDSVGQVVSAAEQTAEWDLLPEHGEFRFVVKQVAGAMEATRADAEAAFLEVFEATW